MIYLAYLAWMMWRESGALDFDNAPGNRGATRTTVTAFLINILNPKLSIFFLAFLPQFVPRDAASPVPHMLMLSAVFMVMTLAVFVAYGVFANLYPELRVEFAEDGSVDTTLVLRDIRRDGNKTGGGRALNPPTGTTDPGGGPPGRGTIPGRAETLTG